eukprot:TRINITY_DN32533_c0_g1_i1.p1 TRINITY_DN32533_c0_g1~~TRINITY_DN32533_c0_g1_i1.p1  ORF type:complete len:229 (-),score=18.19 TRINITY_DN32533_c0_g1_i1:534-1220(-)
MAAVIAGVSRLGSLSSNELVSITELAQLKHVVRLGGASRASRTAICAVLPLDCCVALTSWGESVWVSRPEVLMALACRAASFFLLPALRRALLDALTELAARRNLCPARVVASCYTQLGRGGVKDVAVRFDFRCPRGHGALRPLRGVPAAYSLHSGTNDLTLACRHCQRLQIEEDALIFHCPRFGCCYDLCIQCAEWLCHHRQPNADEPSCPTDGSKAEASENMGCVT